MQEDRSRFLTYSITIRIIHILEYDAVSKCLRMLPDVSPLYYVGIPQACTKDIRRRTRYGTTYRTTVFKDSSPLVLEAILMVYILHIRISVDGGWRLLSGVGRLRD